MPTPLARRLVGLRRVAAKGGAASLGEIHAHLAGQSLPLAVLVLAAIGALPSPGLPVGTVTGMAVIVLAASALGGDAPLPGAIARRRLPAQLLGAALRRLVPPIRLVERLGRPRLRGFAHRASVFAWVLIAVQGVLLALPVPLGNVPPALAIMVLAVALVRRDGAWMLAGISAAVAASAAFAGIGWALWAALATWL